MFTQERTQKIIPVREFELRVGRIEIDIYRRPAAATFWSNTVTIAKVKQKVRLSEESCNSPCSWAVFEPPRCINKHPPILEANLAKKGRGCFDAVIIGAAEVI